MDTERYRILKSNDNMLYNENIPLIINKMHILEDNYTGKKHIEVTFRNIGNRIINTILFCVEFFDEIKNSKVSRQFCSNNLNLHSCAEIDFTDDLDLTNINFKDEPIVKIQKILFENKEKIDTEYNLKPLLTNDYLANLGELKIQYIKEILKLKNNIKVKSIYHDYEKYWHCVCGNYYFNDIKICPNCHVEKEKLLSITDEKYLSEKKKEYEEKQKNLKKDFVKFVKKHNSILKIIGILIMGLLIIICIRIQIMHNLIKLEKIKWLQ